MGRPHAMIIPYPAQGHVIPMMTLAHRLIEHGIKITFVNTEFNNERVVAASPGDDNGQLQLVSIPDGLGKDEDRNDLGKLSEAMLLVMPASLEKLIGKINESDDDKISYIISDVGMVWALEVAEKIGLRRAAFATTAVGAMATTVHIPDLIEAGIIDANGFPSKHQMFQLSPTMPPVNTAHLVWLCIGDVLTQQIMFEFIKKTNKAAQLAQFILCNSFYEIEHPAFHLVPNTKPIGPLLANDCLLGRTDGNFWLKDSTCLSWLDRQPSRSVIYVAFGSFTVFNSHQFHELALGLELSGRPFLWVVRPDLLDGSIATYPDGFLARIADRGRVVDWSPQQKVLAHPSIACFLTHCGWNSTLEGLSNGLPFICWPYFADQFFNRTYICDVWKVGLGLEADSNGIVTAEEMKKKVQELLGDEDIRARTLQFKEMARKSVSEGGTSFKNFNDLVREIIKP